MIIAKISLLKNFMVYKSSAVKCYVNYCLITFREYNTPGELCPLIGNYIFQVIVPWCRL